MNVALETPCLKKKSDTMIRVIFYDNLVATNVGFIMFSGAVITLINISNKTKLGSQD